MEFREELRLELNFLNEFPRELAIENKVALMRKKQTYREEDYEKAAKML